MKNIFLILLFGIFLTQQVLAEMKPLDLQTFWKLKRIRDVSFSNSTNSILYQTIQYNLKNNSSNHTLLIHKLTTNQHKKIKIKHGISSFQFSSDGDKIFYISNQKGKSILFEKFITEDQSRQIFQFPTEINNFKINDQQKIACFTARLWYGAHTLDQSNQNLQDHRKNSITAIEITKLPYKLWNEWVNDFQEHLFILDLETQKIIDITPYANYVPPLDLGSHDDLAISSGGKLIAYVTNPDQNLANSTNNQVYIYDRDSKITKCISQTEAVENQPRFSPCQKFLSFKGMKRPGFEADQYGLYLYELNNNKIINLTDSFQRSITDYLWSADSKTIYFTVKDFGRVKIYSLDVNSRKINCIIDQHVNKLIDISSDGKNLFFKQQSADLPDEIFKINLMTKEIKQITFQNKEILSHLEMNSIEDFTFKSYDQTEVHGLLLKPPFFDKEKKYPMIFLIHGGPQGAWEDEFHYRWNYQLFASRGNVVAAVNFRGSRGYGQAFCDAVSGNWGDGPYRDLIAGLDYLVENFSFIDTSKISAAGASYGGYMINWIAVNNQATRFKSLVSHAGVFDLFSKYGTTEELWFPEWEFKGDPYYYPELYEKFSPSKKAKNLQKNQVPMLITHGEHDYRVPINQAMQLFTALQRFNVPSKFIYFPDEDHFVRKPQNSVYWWNQVLDWIDHYSNHKNSSNQ